METFDFYPNQKVTVKTDSLNGKGRIVGCATIRFPEIGSTYIVELDDPVEAGVDLKVYPFKCVAIPQSFIRGFSPLDLEIPEYCSQCGSEVLGFHHCEAFNDG